MKTELKYKTHATMDKHNGRKKTKDIHLETMWFSKRDLSGKKKNHRLMTHRKPGIYFTIVNFIRIVGYIYIYILEQNIKYMERCILTTKKTFQGKSWLL